MELDFTVARFVNDGDAVEYASTRIFFDQEAGGDSEDAYLESMFDAFRFRDTGVDRPAFDLKSLIGTSDTSKYWLYQGSLTSPPCTENVESVIVLKQPRGISDEQLKRIQDVLVADPGIAINGGNNRAVQP